MSDKISIFPRTFEFYQQAAAAHIHQLQNQPPQGGLVLIECKKRQKEYNPNKTQALENVSISLAKHCLIYII